MPKLQIISNFGNANAMRSYFSKMFNNQYGWNDLEIVASHNQADFYIIINHPADNYHELNKSILIQMEPEFSVSKWDKIWSNPDINNFFFVFNTKNYHNSIEWHINYTYHQLKTLSFQKTKLISTITSDKCYMIGHQIRGNFLRWLDKIEGSEIYGVVKGDTNNSKIIGNLKNYKGALKHKNEGLDQFKYTFASENCSQPNYFTEKLIDSILCECLCFYWGCPNIDTFINPKCYIVIDLFKPEEAFETIQKSIENDEWEKRLPFIKKEKERILEELHILPTIEKIIYNKSMPL